MFLNSRLIIVCIFIFLYPSFSAAYHNDQYNSRASYPVQYDCLSMPSKDEKIHQQLSKEERQWYATFQHGSLLFDGWQDICQKVLEEVPPQKEAQTASLLGSMGKRIGTEWAKNNAVRKIDTEQLRQWGSRLKDAREKGGDEIYETVEKISDEVDAILKK